MADQIDAGIASQAALRQFQNSQIHGDEPCSRKSVLVDGVPKCVIRPTDKKDLDRFVRNAKKYLQAGNEEAKCTYRGSRRCGNRDMEARFRAA